MTMKLSTVLQKISTIQTEELCLKIIAAGALRLAAIKSLDAPIKAVEELETAKRQLEGEKQRWEGERKRLELLTKVPVSEVMSEQRAEEEKAERADRAKQAGIKVVEYRNANAELRDGHWHCLYCGRRLRSKEQRAIVVQDFSVVVLRDGADFMAQACSEDCRDKAADTYVKEKECLRQQLTELRAMKQMVSSINHEALRLLKQESQPEKSLAHS